MDTLTDAAIVAPELEAAGPAPRRMTVPVQVGRITVGGGAPVVVQSMTNTDTADAAGTALQIAASFSDTSWAFLWNTPRSRASIATTNPRKPAHSQGLPIVSKRNSPSAHVDPGVRFERRGRSGASPTANR